MGHTQGKESNSQWWLRIHAEIPTAAKDRERGVEEASYGEVTRKSMVNKNKIFYTDLSSCLSSD